MKRLCIIFGLSCYVMLTLSYSMAYHTNSLLSAMSYMDDQESGSDADEIQARGQVSMFYLPSNRHTKLYLQAHETSQPLTKEQMATAIAQRPELGAKILRYGHTLTDLRLRKVPQPECGSLCKLAQVVPGYTNAYIEYLKKRDQVLQKMMNPDIATECKGKICIFVDVL